jgi:spore coat polysaccharide biosynthesis protein SpsF
MKIGAIIQARMSSSRLPAKILKYLPYNSNITVLQQVIQRVKKSKNIQDIIVATTEKDEDSEIVKIAENESVNYFQGSLDNVLERFYFAAKENLLDIVVRITSDCPCLDFEVLDFIINEHLKNKNDYTSNTLKRTFFHGADAEVFTFEVLEESYKNANKTFEKEHVTPYIYKTNKDKFKIQNIEANKNYFAPEIRLTLDTIEDYTLLCAVFDYLHEKNNFFTTRDIIDLFEEKPWLKNINKKIIQKKIFNTLEEEIEEALNILELQDLYKVVSLLKNNIIF